MDVRDILRDVLNAAEEEDIKKQNSVIMKSLRDTMDPFYMTQWQFTRIFRLSQETVRYLCDVLRPRLQRERSSGLAVETQVLAALRFFAIGSYQRGVGNDFLVSISQPAVSRAIKAVAQGIVHVMVEEWIQFPTTEEKRQAVKRRFAEERNFRGGVGCIDCTHIAIKRPKLNEHVYANYKGFHSLNVQAVASHDLEILSFSARYPGTVHDSFIWRYSALREEMVRLWDSGDHNTWLLGDSGYGLEPWLMTPITDAAEGTPEAMYTARHCSARNCVERMFGLLKSVWRCLLGHRVLHYEPVMAAYIITACAVLHDLRLRHNLMNEDFDIDEDGEAEAQRRAERPEQVRDRDRVIAQAMAVIGEEDEDNVVHGDRLHEARRVRTRIVRTQFGLRE